MHNYAGFLTIIEDDFNCAGVCTPSSYYLFTDVNRGKPVGNCKSAISEKLGTYIHPKGWAMIFIGGLGFLACPQNYVSLPSVFSMLKEASSLCHYLLIIQVNIGGHLPTNKKIPLKRKLIDQF